MESSGAIKETQEGKSQRSALPQTLSEKIEAAQALKDEGNNFFKQSEFMKAKVRYARALAYTKGLPGRKDNASDPMTSYLLQNRPDEPSLSEEQLNQIVEVESVLKTNIAVCFLRLNRPADALEYAKQALAQKPQSWKALLRKGEALTMLKNYQEALKALDEALLYHPDESNRISIMNARKKAVEGAKQEAADQKKAFRNIFERAQKSEK